MYPNINDFETYVLILRVLAVGVLVLIILLPAIVAAYFVEKYLTKRKNKKANQYFLDMAKYAVSKGTRELETQRETLQLAIMYCQLSGYDTKTMQVAFDAVELELNKRQDNQNDY